MMKIIQILWCEVYIYSVVKSNMHCLKKVELSCDKVAWTLG